MPVLDDITANKFLNFSCWLPFRICSVPTGSPSTGCFDVRNAFDQRAPFANYDQFMMDPIEDDLVNDEPLSAEPNGPAKRRRPRPSILEPPPRRREVIGGRANYARERAELFLRENPVPMIVGALVAGVAIGLAIRYASRDEEKTVEIKTPLGQVNWSVLSLPFLWPFFRGMKEKIEDSADAIKDGVARVKDIDVDRYTKPIRKRWKSWTG